jgi:hypothetical protein
MIYGEGRSRARASPVPNDIKYMTNYSCFKNLVLMQIINIPRKSHHLKKISTLIAIYEED